MKTRVNIENLKMAVVTICSALVLTTAGFTQPNPDVYESDEVSSMIRLEALMNGTEHSIRFIAPVAEETEEAVSALERLNVLTDLTEAAMKYEAPAAEEVREIVPEMERLDKLADLTEVSIKYEAPSIEQAEVSPELERLDMLAAAIETELVFKAPAADDVPDFDNVTEKSNEIMLADKNK